MKGLIIAVVGLAAVGAGVAWYIGKEDDCVWRLDWIDAWGKENDIAILYLNDDDSSFQFVGAPYRGVNGLVHKENSQTFKVLADDDWEGRTQGKPFPWAVERDEDTQAKQSYCFWSRGHNPRAQQTPIITWVPPAGTHV